jgi:2,3-dihydroxybiphenyl 1,2-dioxygenase
MRHQLEIAYARVEVADRDTVATFFTDVVGLAPSDPTSDGDLTWTDDDAVQRVILSEGPANDLAALGFEAVDADAFDLTFERLSDTGFAPAMHDDLATPRRVKQLASVDAPWGSPVEVAVDHERSSHRLPTPLMPGGFLTTGQGFGHAVIATTEFDEALRFVTDGLGLVQSDWLETELAPGIGLEVHFFHCNARHHSLALARAPFEMPRLHHLMFETNDRDDVGHAFDRAFEAGCALPNGLGLHDNDRMFSFYVASPAGFQVEVGHGARQVSEPWTDDRRYDRISAWGHQPVAPRG